MLGCYIAPHGGRRLSHPHRRAHPLNRRRRRPLRLRHHGTHRPSQRHGLPRPPPLGARRPPRIALGKGKTRLRRTAPRPQILPPHPPRHGRSRQSGRALPPDRPPSGRSEIAVIPFARLCRDPLLQCRLFIHVASRIVPRRSRPDWLAEWRAELHHAGSSLLRGDNAPQAAAQLRRWCRGALADALWMRFNREDLSAAFAVWARTRSFCLAALASVVLLIAAASGFLPATRATLLPLPYAAPDRVATVTEAESSLSMRSGVPDAWTAYWRAHSHSLSALAPYRWRLSRLDDNAAPIRNAQVSAGFFDLLGVSAASGRLFHAAGSRACSRCVVISDDLRRSLFGASPAVGRSLPIDGIPYRIAGVLPPNFWFLSRRIDVWSLAPSLRGAHAGLLVRLRPGVSPSQAAREMSALLRQAGLAASSPLLDVSPLQQRVRSPLDSFALALVLAIAAALLANRQSLYTARLTVASLRRSAFFLAKTALLLLAVLLFGLEFTPAAAITMLGGTDLLTEPLSTWLFLIGCMSALTWSIQDQQVRCRVCLRRLGLAAHVGCRGCVWLNWAGTEMVCMRGHGMLHVPEMPSSWNGSGRWTLLDESWQPLFSKNP